MPNVSGAKTPDPRPLMAHYPDGARALAERFAGSASQLAWVCGLLRSRMARGQAARPGDAEPPARLGIETSGSFAFLSFCEPRALEGIAPRDSAGFPMLFASMAALLGEWSQDGSAVAQGCAQALARLAGRASQDAQALLDWRPGAPDPSWNAAQAKAHFRRDGSKLLAEALLFAGFKPRKLSGSPHHDGFRMELDAPGSLDRFDPDALAVARALRSLKLLGGESFARVEALALLGRDENAPDDCAQSGLSDALADPAPAARPANRL